MNLFISWFSSFHDGAHPLTCVRPQKINEDHSSRQIEANALFTIRRKLKGKKAMMCEKTMSDVPTKRAPTLIAIVAL